MTASHHADRACTGWEAIRTLADIPRVHAGLRPDHLAKVFEARRTTYGQWQDLTSRVANGLRAGGMPPQTRVAYLGKNSDRFFDVYIGVAKAGMVLVPVNWRLVLDEMAFILADAQVQVLFIGAEYHALRQALCEAVPTLALVVSVDGADGELPAFDDWLARQDAADPALPADPGDVVLQLYTSGTTGRPKGALLSHRNLLSMFRHAAQGELGRWRADDVFLLSLPMFHVAGAVWGLIALYLGCTDVILREANPTLILAALRTWPVTKVSTVPAVLQSVLDHADAATADFSRLDLVTYGGAPMPQDVLRRGLAALGPVFLQVYGMTETSGVGTVLPQEAHDPAYPERLLSCGKPISGMQLRIVGPDGQPLGPGESGEILLRGDPVMLGYWNRPGPTAEALRDGWYHSGDVGFVDADGYLTIRDRLKDMIISGGENVYPAEVENALCDHPDVAEAGVIGVPDAKWGEAVKAIVVLRPGRHVEAVDIIGFLRSRIAGYKCPKTVDFVDSLPRNPTGKILKRVLRAPYWTDQPTRI
ncbi:MAG: long-chain-fatty-acid--CoA ligase [Burkholderiales bacterium]